MKEIILKIDKNDNVVGEISKEVAHDDEGILHRAFLVIIFNKKEEILLTKRSKFKRLWPGFWDGSVASHQRKDETLKKAVVRRLKEEVNLRVKKVTRLFKFYYRNAFGKTASEREICHVFKIKIKNKISPDKKEISDFKWINLKEIQKDIKKNPQKYTPWFLIVFKQFLNDVV